MAETNVIHVHSNNWQSEVMSSSLPVLVDFWATWCGPCKMHCPILDELSVELSGKLKIAKVDVDENPELAGRVWDSVYPHTVGDSRRRSPTANDRRHEQAGVKIENSSHFWGKNGPLS